ncbi:RHS repeat-associated core domain-containing protein, partial [Ralstonia pseudosolanacearum]
ICQKRDANGQLLRAYYPEGEYGPEIGKRVAKADAGIEADEDGDERYGHDQDAGKSDQPAETTGSLIYTRNHLGSVTDTLTPNGRAVTHTEYGPYGELVKSQGRAEYRADFGYAGMQYHAASGMYLTLFRAYDPGTGRWVSRDPIGEEGGINLYAYVDGNPVSKVDPTGEIAFVPILAGIGVGLAFDYAVSKWKEEHCKCKNASTPAGASGNAAAGAANGTFGPYATKPRTGIAGGGEAGAKTSVYSQAVSEAYQRGAINVGMRRVLRDTGRFISKRLPYVSAALASYEVYDAFNCD